MHNHRIAESLTSWLRRGLFLILLALAACGGGGGSDNASSSSSSNTPASAPAGVPNAVTVAVAQGVAGDANIPTVSVTVCAPGTGNCQTINNVQVDTESFGLRILASALSSSVSGALPTSTANSGGTLAECANFADGYMWGTVRTADVKVGGETASAIPVQVVGDLSSVPADCQSLGSAKDTPSDIGANGILGIGVAPADCDAACAADATVNGYYGCPSGTNCTPTTVTTAQTVANPVAHFATDNNGVILQLPQVGSSGASSVSGTLYFGIGTQSNNALTATQRFATDSSGDVSATYNGGTFPYAFLDSGSNGLYFSDSTIAQCTGNYKYFYCPSSQLTLSATLIGVDGSSGAVSFDIGNAETLYGTGNLAFNNLGGAFGSTQDFDLGLPFFYGKTVYYGYGSAPYVAF